MRTHLGRGGPPGALLALVLGNVAKGAVAAGQGEGPTRALILPLGP